MKARALVHRLAFVAAAAAAVPIVIAACGEDTPSIPDVSTLPDGAADDGASDGGRDTGADTAPQPCTPPIHPDDTVGVYVSTTGANGASCGTRTSPCRTIAAGLARAAAEVRDVVYVAQGTYEERVKVLAGIELSGGWLFDGVTNTWTKACTNVSNAVTVRAPGAETTTIDAINLGGGPAKLTDLRVESKLGAVGPGESIYGIVAVGVTTTLSLSGVDIVVGKGGDGADAPSADAGANGGSGCVVASGGAAGPNGTAGAGAPAGAFDVNGYLPKGGGDGTNGGAGQNGTNGSDGFCVTCGACPDPVLCTFVGNGGPQNCGTRGAPGCAGAGGFAGVGATGGGSSVGLFCFNANVKISGGRITTSSGGNGGTGGAGGPGGKGAPGVRGDPSPSCTTGCTAPAAGVCNPVPGQGDGGFEGGAGGAGGSGGAGGGGAGGWSVAIVQGGTGIVTAGAVAPVLMHGAPGKGGGPSGSAGAAGTAANRYP